MGHQIQIVLNVQMDTLNGLFKMYVLKIVLLANFKIILMELLIFMILNVNFVIINVFNVIKLQYNVQVVKDHNLIILLLLL